MINMSPRADMRTARLTGRRVSRFDAALLARIWRDPQGARWLSASGEPWSRARVKMAAERLAAHWTAHRFGPRMWFHERRFVGYAGLKFAQIDRSPCVEIMWGAPPDAWGRGFITEAAAACLSEDLGYKEITAITLPDNIRSQAVMTRLGFAPGRDIIHGNMPHRLFRLDLSAQTRAALAQRCEVQLL